MGEGGIIPFPDTMTYRLNTSGFTFTVYRTPTYSGQYLHYFSGHSKKVKQAVLFSMFLRAYRISDDTCLQAEVNFITKTSEPLGYTTRHKIGTNYTGLCNRLIPVPGARDSTPIQPVFPGLRDIYIKIYG